MEIKEGKLSEKSSTRRRIQTRKRPTALSLNVKNLRKIKLTLYTEFVFSKSIMKHFQSKYLVTNTEVNTVIIKITKQLNRDGFY